MLNTPIHTINILGEEWLNMEIDMGDDILDCYGKDMDDLIRDIVYMMESYLNDEHDL